jgi:hypothetical protein
MRYVVLVVFHVPRRQDIKLEPNDPSIPEHIRKDRLYLTDERRQRCYLATAVEEHYTRALASVIYILHIGEIFIPHIRMRREIKS